jgi:hypothetical protein
VTELRIWPDTDGPSRFAASSAGQSVSTEFTVTTGTWWLKELRIWRGAWDMIGPFYGRLYTVDSPTSGTPVSGTDVKITPRGLGWQTATLLTPVAVTAGKTYRATFWTPNGACYTPDYWSW